MATDIWTPDILGEFRRMWDCNPDEEGAGVYLLRSSEGKIYVGQSGCVYQRIVYGHHKHLVPEMQADFNRLDGSESFSYWIVEPLEEYFE